MRCALRHDLAPEKQGAAAGIACAEFNIVAYQKHGLALIAQLRQKLAEALLELPVHALCRLVEQQHIGMYQQQLSECETLLLAARYVKGVALKKRFKLKEPHELRKLRFAGSHLAQLV